MPYLTPSNTPHDTEPTLDAERFLADLARELGGAEIEPQYKGGVFVCGPLRVYVRQGYGAKARRVHIGCNLADLAEIHRARREGRFPDFPSAWVDPDKAWPALVKDIRRRVIDAAQAPLAQVRQMADDGDARTDRLRTAVDAVNALAPGAATMPEGNSYEAPLYLGRGVYLNGRLTSDGAIYVDRLGTIPADKVADFLALLTR
jgi:hypothetical protein